MHGLHVMTPLALMTFFFLLPMMMTTKTSRTSVAEGRATSSRATKSMSTDRYHKEERKRGRCIVHGCKQGRPSSSLRSLPLPPPLSSLASSCRPRRAGKERKGQSCDCRSQVLNVLLNVLRKCSMLEPSSMAETRCPGREDQGKDHALVAEKLLDESQVPEGNGVCEVPDCRQRTTREAGASVGGSQ